MKDEDSPGVHWIDSHAHLTMFERDEVAEVLDRAIANGVAGVLVPATGPGDLERTLELADEFPDRIVTAAGVHPHEANCLDSAAKAELERALVHAGVVAVGEIGLDYHYMNSPREDQLSACEWQLGLAEEAGLPVVIHNRDSWPDLERLLSVRQGRVRGVCHSFTEGPSDAIRVIEIGLMVGISGMITFKAADNIREMAAALGPPDVMVETDSPFLAPVPHRGQRNEPGLVARVGDRLAGEWRLTPEIIANETTTNFRRTFEVKSEWACGIGVQPIESRRPE
jgi:TatD DNase family protein